ncbi:Calx-beta domain-containing protein [Actinokineospora sp. HUAS TT18]|uniref:Calx-beta domain-containing protein n=1 Tax=Actinokineospora sp. HUAS TT18 TaxID=3447451 RepID=UPI003F51EAFC
MKLVKGLLATAAIVGTIIAAPQAGATGCSTTVAINSTIVHEGSDALRTAVTFTVTSTASTGCTPSGTVDWATKDGTADETDYEAGQGTLLLTGQNTITVYVKRDIDAENNESFHVALSNPSTGVTINSRFAIGTATVLDDDGRVWGPVMTEIQGGKVCWVPNDCKIPVKITKAPNIAVTVKYSTIDGTAKGGYDYVAADNATLTIPAGKTEAYISIQLLPSEGREGVEEFGILISDPSAGFLGNPKSTVTVNP